MVNVVRAFFQCLVSPCEEVLRELQERFNVVKAYQSKVVPNFFFIEIEGEADEVEKFLSERGVSDLKVVKVVA